MKKLPVSPSTSDYVQPHSEDILCLMPLHVFVAVVATATSTFALVINILQAVA